MSEKHTMLNYDQITDSIYIGSNQCCQVHFEEELLSKGIETDISLEEERLDRPFGVKFFTWLPTKDHTPPSVDQLKHGVAVIENLITLHKKTYVHCKNGHGRAPTLVAAYLIQTGMSPEEAIQLIKERRPVIHLEDSQVNALHEFAQKKLSDRK